jgi:hypothetical protein
VTGGEDPGTYALDDTTPDARRFPDEPVHDDADRGARPPSDYDLNGNTTLLPFRDDMASTTVLATATYDYRNRMVRYERRGPDGGVPV